MLPLSAKGGSGVEQYPDPLKKARYRIGVKRVPSEEPEYVTIFTNGRPPTLETTDQMRFNRHLATVELPIYIEPQARDVSAKSSENRQIARSNSLMEEFILEAKIDNLLRVTFDTEENFLGKKQYSRNLKDFILKIYPKVQDTKFLVYEDVEHNSIYVTDDTFKRALNNIQNYITSNFIKPFSYHFKKVPYGMAIYHNAAGLDEEGLIASLDLQRDRAPCTHFEFFNHRAHIEEDKDRDRPKDDMYTYVYLTLVALQMKRMLIKIDPVGGGYPLIDTYAMSSELIAQDTGYGETSRPEDLPLRADDIITEVLKNPFRNISIAYPYINFDNIDAYEIFKFNLLLTLATKRIKIPTAQYRIMMDTRDWEHVTLDAQDVFHSQLPGIGSDSTPYMILADNLGYADPKTKSFGFFLPYRLGEGVNDYHVVKDPAVVETYGNAIRVINGRIDGTPFEPLSKTILYAHYDISPDSFTTSTEYMDDTIHEMRAPKHYWKDETYSSQHRRFLYIMSMFCNSSSVFADGLITPRLPDLLGPIPTIYKAVNNDYFGKQVVVQENEKTGETEKVSVNSIKKPGAPVVTEQKVTAPAPKEELRITPPQTAEAKAATEIGVKPKTKEELTDGAVSNSNDAGEIK